jgi:hypothetical protein
MAVPQKPGIMAGQDATEPDPPLALKNREKFSGKFDSLRPQLVGYNLGNPTKQENVKPSLFK